MRFEGHSPRVAADGAESSIDDRAFHQRVCERKVNSSRPSDAFAEQSSVSLITYVERSQNGQGNSAVRQGSQGIFSMIR